MAFSEHSTAAAGETNSHGDIAAMQTYFFPIHWMDPPGGGWLVIECTPLLAQSDGLRKLSSQLGFCLRHFGNIFFASNWCARFGDPGTAFRGNSSDCIIGRGILDGPGNNMAFLLTPTSAVSPAWDRPRRPRRHPAEETSGVRLALRAAPRPRPSRRGSHICVPTDRVLAGAPKVSKWPDPSERPLAVVAVPLGYCGSPSCKMLRWSRRPERRCQGR